MKPEKYLDEQDKEKAVTYDLHFILPGTILESKVKCQKCGREFLYNNSTVLELFDVVGSYEIIRCKHYPECDGLRQNFEVIK